MKEFVCKVSYNTTQELMEALVKEFSKEINKEDIPSIDFFIERLSNKFDYNVPQMQNLISTLCSIYLPSAISLLMREIALYYDSKYKDCITDSKDIFAVSMTDGRIHQLNKAGIKNYKNFAAFRTLEDAKCACKILREPLKAMFNAKKK